MTVKLVILKSGEHLITNIKEGYNDQGLITYILENPCTIRINSSHKIMEDGEDPVEKVNVSLSSWPNFSADEMVAIPPDWLVTALNPAESIKKIYENKFLEKNDQTTTVVGQSDTDFEN